LSFNDRRFPAKAQRQISIDRDPGAVYRGHVAFEVEDVAEALRAMTAAGGSRLGDVVTLAVPGAGTITWTYARDPEENIIELQSWSKTE
jgi:predicted enzyme related to lactoylglutathione lyase